MSRSFEIGQEIGQEVGQEVGQVLAGTRSRAVVPYVVWINPGLRRNVGVGD
jgi:hypothetical protein